MWLVAMSVNIGHITADNGRADRNELLKMYFVYVGTLSQWRINQNENRTSSVFNVSDNITDISDTDIPIKEQIHGC